MNAQFPPSAALRPDGDAPPRRRWARIWNTAAFALLVLAFLVALLWNHIFVTIPPGTVGVLWLRFFGGTVTTFHYREGTKAIFPWDRVFFYSTRLQRLDHTTTALSSDGLPVTMEVSVLFGLRPELAGLLHVRVGPEYISRLLDPLVSASVRERIADNRAEHVYTVAHRSIEDDIAAGLQQKLGLRVDLPGAVASVIRIADFSVRSVTLPPAVRESIENRLVAEQALQRYRLSIDQERLEAERRGIEAEGIRRFQEVVVPGISDSFLRWRGIEATVALSQSPNAKIVVIGGANGLPLILDGRGETVSPGGAGVPQSPGEAPGAAPGGAPAAPEPGGGAPLPQPSRGEAPSGRAGVPVVPRHALHGPPPSVRSSALGLPSLAMPPPPAVGSGLSATGSR